MRKDMKFSIITPTHRRSNFLPRVITSLQNQTYSNWEILIINDSPQDESYHDFESKINDRRIRYYKNETNRGVNFSRNRALNLLSSDSKYVIFLDDDDYFAPDTLQYFYEKILTDSSLKWIVSNRALKNGKALTEVKSFKEKYSYAWDYLIFRRIKGDATHCIEVKLINQNRIHFSRSIKQGEEWFFFYQIGLQAGISYTDHNSTISDGYDLVNGLNFRRRPLSEKIKTLTKIAYEAIPMGLIVKPSFMFYLLMRYIRIIIPIKNNP